MANFQKFKTKAALPRQEEAQQQRISKNKQLKKLIQQKRKTRETVKKELSKPQTTEVIYNSKRTTVSHVLKKPRKEEKEFPAEVQKQTQDYDFNKTLQSSLGVSYDPYYILYLSDFLSLMHSDWASMQGVSQFQVFQIFFQIFDLKLLVNKQKLLQIIFLSQWKGIDCQSLDFLSNCLINKVLDTQFWKANEREFLKYLSMQGNKKRCR